MWEATVRMPEQMENALSAVEAACDLPDCDRIDNVVVVGMGGSGIAGDVAVATAAPFMPIPVNVLKGYELPSYVGRNSLVVAVSFSGNTEETLEVFGRAIHHGALGISVSGGGSLAELSREMGVCHISVDASIPQPRAAFGALSVSVLAALDRVGVFSGASSWVKEAIEQLKARRSDLLGTSSPAEALARSLRGRIPLIVSSAPIGAVAAMRWKTQINENVKGPAFFSVYPEACHNELAGFERYPELLKEHIFMLVLRHQHEHPNISRRYSFARSLLADRLAGFTEVEGKGGSELAELFDLVFFGDVMSLYLARELGVDPGPIPVLNDMKSYMARGNV